MLLFNDRAHFVLFRLIKMQVDMCKYLSCLMFNRRLKVPKKLCQRCFSFFYQNSELAGHLSIISLSLFFFFLHPVAPLPRVFSPQPIPHFFTNLTFLCLLRGDTAQYKAKFAGSLKRGDIVQTFPRGRTK